MNPNGQSHTRPLTEEAMKKEFTIKMKRDDILIIHNAFATQNNYTLQDAQRIQKLLDLFKDALVLVEKDFVPLPTPPAPPAPTSNGIKV